MTRQRADQALFVAWIAMVGVQVARAAARGAWTWPRPSLVVAPTILYTGLSILSMAAPSVAVTMAVGIDLAVALSPAASNAVTGTLTRVLMTSAADSAAQNAGSALKSYATGASSPAPTQSVAGTTTSVNPSRLYPQ